MTLGIKRSNYLEIHICNWACQEPSAMGLRFRVSTFCGWQAWVLLGYRYEAGTWVLDVCQNKWRMRQRVRKLENNLRPVAKTDAVFQVGSWSKLGLL